MNYVLKQHLLLQNTYKHRKVLMECCWEEGISVSCSTFTAVKSYLIEISSDCCSCFHHRSQVTIIVDGTCPKREHSKLIKVLPPFLLLLYVTNGILWLHASHSIDVIQLMVS